MMLASRSQIPLTRTSEKHFLVIKFLCTITFDLCDKGFPLLRTGIQKKSIPKKKTYLQEDSVVYFQLHALVVELLFHKAETVKVLADVLYLFL